MEILGADIEPADSAASATAGPVFGATYRVRQTGSCGDAGDGGAANVGSNDFTPATGERHEAANMATIDR